MKNNKTYFLNSVSELHHFLNIKKPTHPLVSVVNLDDLDCIDTEEMSTIVFNYYTIYLKKNFDGKIKYGQQYYDFDDGIMTFFAPSAKCLAAESRSLNFPVDSATISTPILFQGIFAGSVSLVTGIGFPSTINCDFSE